MLGVPVHLYARLAPGIRTAQARDEFGRLYPAIVEAELALSPESTPDRGQQARAQALAHRPWLEQIGRGRSGFMLLVLVCVNAGGLMLARSEAKRHEIAIRLSLGASRAQIVRFVL